MRNSEYWRGRFEQLEETVIADALVFSQHAIEQYEKSISKIQKDIDIWYTRLANNNGISFQEAKRLLEKNELKEFKWTVEEYIEKGRENAVNQKWITQLENASSKVHISRLDSLKIQINAELEDLYSGLNSDMTDSLSNLYTTKYYNTAFEIQKGFNTAFDVIQLDKNSIEKALLNGWSVNGKNFSDRIWNDKTKLIENIKTKIVQSTVRGDSKDTLINEISKEMNVSVKNVKRLVMTESAYVSSLAEYDCYKDLEVDEYEIVATLDKRTSNVCQGLDGKIFKISEYEIGTTAPPFHPNCRSTTVPAIDSFESGTRASKGMNGKTTYIPMDMKYKEWYDTFVVSS